LLAGGAIYCENDSILTFTDCDFNGNGAYTYFYYDELGNSSDGAVYTKAGALYIGGESVVNMVGCGFINNGGGAIYSDAKANLTIVDCQFTGNFNYKETEDYSEFEGYEYFYNSEPPSSPTESHMVQGGAIFIGLDGVANINNSNFIDNFTYGVGGAINSKGHLVIENSVFSLNRAFGDGGAIESYIYPADPCVLLTEVTLADCIFANNKSGRFGGAMHADEFDATLSDCSFFGNTAESGGALHFANGVVDVDGGIIRANKATGTLIDNEPTTDEGYGGGVACISTTATIQNCIIGENTAAGSNGSGGGLCFYGGGGLIEHSIKNCLIHDNISEAFGGGVSCSIYTAPKIDNCTFAHNSADVFGSGIFCDWSSDAQVTNSIFASNNGFAVVHEDGIGGNSFAQNSLFNGNLTGDYYDAATGSTYTGAAEIDSISANFFSNLAGNPLFADGPRGKFYLGQNTSPAVDAGNDTEANLGLDIFTTDPDGIAPVLDTGLVDLGYHYIPSIPAEYTLTVQNNDGHGFIQVEPVTAGNKYVFGELVKVTAIPDTGYFVDSWSGGTIDDGSIEFVNYVLMYSDKTITVEFRFPVTIRFPGDADSVQNAIGMANHGDTVEVLSGVHHGGDLVVNKEIIIRGTNPDDPCVVAATIIDCAGYVNRGVRFTSEAGEDTLFSGITIANGTWYVIPSDDGEQPDRPDGDNGGWAVGGGIYCSTGSAPTISNCVVRDCRITGGNAGSGAAATEENDAGRGGWGGWARGGGVYIAEGSAPTFINTTIRDCTATGGNGGNGGDYAEGDGWYSSAGYGGLWSNDYYAPWWEWEYVGDYRFYSSYGGGVYCAEGSSATFIACTITENRTRGGMSGMSGIGGAQPGTRREPVFSYEIPSYGGGVYCAKDSVISFIECTITDNVSQKPSFDPETIEVDEETGEITGEPIYHLDPYLGHGGGVASEETAMISFENCIISGNVASCGGGLYMASSDPEIVDCVLTGNLSYQGGAIFATHGSAILERSDFAGNLAGFINGDVDNVAGQGGAVYCASIDADIVDCNMMGNEAGASGGGIFFTGGDANSPIVDNCLLAYNVAGRDGGGISVNWYSMPAISNCTIFENRATGEFSGSGIGGGLYASYHSYPTLFDSILWGNTAGIGRQIAVGTGFEFDPRPATLEVSHCDIQGGKSETAAHFDEDCTLTWLGGIINEDPLFVEGPHGDFYLSQIAASHPDSVQTVDSPCVDTGSTSAVNIGMHEYVTRNDDSLDVYDKGWVDMGYHYPPTVPLEICRFVDVVFDGIVNFADFKLFADHWLDDCTVDDCEGTSLTVDNTVDELDFVKFADCWLVKDNDPPQPNPAEWRLTPYTDPGSTSIDMMAKVSYDNWSEIVEYQFKCTDGFPANTSLWQTDPCWTDSGLISQTSYTYVVRVRDQWENTTADSVPVTIIAGEETNPPGPVRFANVDDDGIDGVPAPGGDPCTISMTAAIAADPEGNGVEYKFFCEPPYTEFSSEWQEEDPAYTATGLTVGTQYCFYVIVRDMSANNNQSDQSDPCCSMPSVQNNPPYPEDGVLGDAATFSTQPYQWGSNHLMVATIATDDEDDDNGIEYLFESDDGVSSGWQNFNEGTQPPYAYEYNIGTSSPTSFRYRVYYKDARGMVSQPSDWFVVP